MLTRTGAALDGATVSESVGEGLDVRLVAPRVHGSALEHDGRVIHLSLFRDELSTPMREA